MTPRPAEHKRPLVTLTWTTTTVQEYRATFPAAVLRQAVNAERERLHQPTDPDFQEDLDLLAESWLADHEPEMGGLLEFDREVTEHRTRPVPPMPAFTVTIEGPERHDGEKPFTYVLHAPHGKAARRVALEHHIRAQELDLDAEGQPTIPDARAVEGPAETFDGPPPWPAHTPGRAWNDLRQNLQALAAAVTAAEPTCY
jgi:hypothetical protein